MQISLLALMRCVIAAWLKIFGKEVASRFTSPVHHLGMLGKQGGARLAPWQFNLYGKGAKYGNRVNARVYG